MDINILGRGQCNDIFLKKEDYETSASSGYYFHLALSLFDLLPNGLHKFLIDKILFQENIRSFYQSIRLHTE